MTALAQRLAQMNVHKAEVDDYLAQAIQMLGEPGQGDTPARIDQAHSLATSYVRLAGAALDRFEEVARG